MKSKNSFFSRRVVLYPIAVFIVGILAAVITPLLVSSINPESFGRATGKMTADALLIALVIGLISDLKRRKKMKQQVQKDSGAI